MDDIDIWPSMISIWDEPKWKCPKGHTTVMTSHVGWDEYHYCAECFAEWAKQQFPITRVEKND